MCCKWIHLKSSSISKNDFLSLSNDSSDWFCNKCLECIFPFNNIQNVFEFHSCLFNLSNSNKLNASLIKNSQQRLAPNYVIVTLISINSSSSNSANMVINIIWKMNLITLYMIIVLNLTFICYISLHVV